MIGVSEKLSLASNDEGRQFLNDLLINDVSSKQYFLISPAINFSFMESLIHGRGLHEHKVKKM